MRTSRPWRCWLSGVVLLLATVQAATFAPNHFLGKCLDDAWVKKVEQTLNISSTSRDSKNRLDHPHLHAAFKAKRYTIKDPRTTDVPITNLYEKSCSPTAFTFWGVDSTVDPSTGAVTNKGRVNGSIVLELRDWASYQLTALTFAILAREILGYEVSIMKTFVAAQMGERMSNSGLGLCTPVHVNVEEWGRKYGKYASEIYKPGVHSYAGRSGLYTTKKFVNNGTDPAKYTPVFSADFWRDYAKNEDLITALNVDTFLNNNKYYPPTEAGVCDDGMYGCRNYCSKTDTCTAREAANKKCLVAVLMYSTYDNGFTESSLANNKIPSYHCFIGATAVESYAVEMEAKNVPIFFYHYEPDPFHFVYPNTFERVFLPRALPELTALTTGLFGENGYGGATANPVAVDFPVTTLSIYASTLILEHPSVAVLLSRISLSEGDMNSQLKIYVDVKKNPSHAVEPDDMYFSAACQWVRDNYSIWKLWLDRQPMCSILDHMKYSFDHCNGTQPREIVFSWIDPDPSDASKPWMCDGGMALPARRKTSRTCEWLKSNYLVWIGWYYGEPQCDANFYTFRVSECDARGKRTATYYWALEDPSDPTKSLECTGGVTLPDSVELECEYTPYGTPIFKAIAALAGVIGTPLVGMIAFVIKFRNEPIIKRSQFEFLLVMITGGILMVCAALLYAGKPTSFLCGARPLVTALAFTLIFGALVVKSMRVYRVFMSGAMKRVVLSSTTMFKILGIFVCVDLLIILAWYVVDFPAPYKQPEAMSALGGEIVELDVCLMSNFIFSALLIFWKAIILFMGLYLSFLIRNVSSDFQESIWIFASSLVVLFGSIIILPMAYVVTLPAMVFYAFLAFMLLGCTALVMGMMLGPKIRRLHERANDTTTTERTKPDSSSVSESRSGGSGGIKGKLSMIRLGSKAQVQVTPVQEFRPKSVGKKKKKTKTKKKSNAGAGASSSSSSSED